MPSIWASSSSPSSTFSNSSSKFAASGLSTSPATASQQSSEGVLSSSPDNLLSTWDSTSTDGRQHAERDNSSQIRIKRFIFGDYDIDWRAIPAVDEEIAFNHATLLHRRDLRCKASRQHYLEVLNSFRVVMKTTSTPDANTVIIDGEEVVDMIG